MAFGGRPTSDLGERAAVAASRRPGPRWAYDGCHDPVLYTQFLALIEGRVQAQSLTDTPDHEVTRSCAGAALPSPPWPVEVTYDERSTALTAADVGALRLHRPGPHRTRHPRPGGVRHRARRRTGTGLTGGGPGL
ncbi:hypothetical protein [Streptomyces canus]|uniref:hypothetical protein n=1 Tax=Streptomyces canus TaxID=58343 RepID=UPI003F540283